jgi:hypothetical protein
MSDTLSLCLEILLTTTEIVLYCIWKLFSDCDGISKVSGDERGSAVIALVLLPVFFHLLRIILKSACVPYSIAVAFWAGVFLLLALISELVICFVVLDIWLRCSTGWIVASAMFIFVAIMLYFNQLMDLFTYLCSAPNV